MKSYFMNIFLLNVVCSVAITLTAIYFQSFFAKISISMQRFYLLGIVKCVRHAILLK